jgi:hypothetical protein
MRRRRQVSLAAALLPPPPLEGRGGAAAGPLQKGRRGLVHAGPPRSGALPPPLALRHTHSLSFFLSLFHSLASVSLLPAGSGGHPRTGTVVDGSSAAHPRLE